MAHAPLIPGATPTLKRPQARASRNNVRCTVPIWRFAADPDAALNLVLSHEADLLETAIGECERFYPAFQFALWGGKKPHEAMEAAMLETVGEA